MTDINQKVIQLRKDWRESQEYALLYEKSKINETDRKVLEYIQEKLQHREAVVSLNFPKIIKRNISLFIFLYFPLFLLANWLIASPLGRFMRWKLAKFP
jgi:hypothetical protein